MANFGKAFSYLIAAQMQALGLILFAYYGGKWLNDHHPVNFNWYIVTFIIAVLGVAQTFYVVIKASSAQQKSTEPSTENKH